MADERTEPIEEAHSIWGQLVQFLQSIFKDSSHRDLKRSYGNECALMMLKDVPHPDLYLRLQNGVTLKSLCDLADVLPVLDDKTFQRHVTPAKNDLSYWVRNVVGDRTLANKLDLLETQEDVARAVNVRVEWFKRRIG